MLTDTFNKQETGNRYWAFMALYLLTVVVNYYMPDIARYSFFAAILIVFLWSKDNPFWIAFLWCLNYAPGYLFHASDPNYSLPFLLLPGLGRDVSYSEVVVLVILLKSVFIRKSIRVNNIFWILIFFSTVLFLFSFAWGISFIKIFRTVRFLIPYGLIWALPKLMPGSDKMRTMFNYLLMFTIPVILCQLYVIFFGQHVMFLLGGSFGLKNESLNDVTFDSLSDLIRPLYSTHILLLNVFYCLFLLLQTPRNKTNKYIPMFLILSLMSLFITGTRGYVIASVFMLLIFMILHLSRMIYYAKYILVGIGLFFLIILSPGIGKQFQLSMERIFTVQSIFEGDRTANGTLKRLTERQPVVMAKAEESPVLGFGFSDEYYVYKDGHVANATLLLNGGVIGVLVFLYFILFLCQRAVLKYRSTGRQEFLAIIIGLTGFLVVHSTSYMVFSFAIGSGNYMAFMLLLGFANILLEENSPVREEGAYAPLLS